MSSLDKNTKKAVASLARDFNRKIVTARETDQKANKERGRADHKISPLALANAVHIAGPEVLSAEGDSFWNEVKRDEPHLRDKHYKTNTASRGGSLGGIRIDMGRCLERIRGTRQYKDRIKQQRILRKEAKSGVMLKPFHFIKT